MHRPAAGGRTSTIECLARATSLLAVLTSGPVAAKPYAYIANHGSNYVSVIDTEDDRVVATISVGHKPAGVAVAPDGRRVYIANLVTNEAQVIDTGALRVVAGIAVGEGSRAFGQFMAPGAVAAILPRQ